MIHEHMVMVLLSEACPTFELPQDYSPATGNDEENEEGRLYLDVAEFVYHLLDLFARQRTECFPAAFRVVERLLVEGDEAVQTLAALGVLETLQNIALNRGWDLDMFVHWLGPESRDAWFGLIRDWGS